jgi:hypothetical protein
MIEDEMMMKRERREGEKSVTRANDVLDHERESVLQDRRPVHKIVNDVMMSPCISEIVRFHSLANAYVSASICLSSTQISLGLLAAMRTNIL